MIVSSFFEQHMDEFKQFQRIKPTELLSLRRDLCALLKLNKIIGENEQRLTWCQYSSGCIPLLVDSERFSEEDVIYLLRCGVRPIPGQELLGLY